MVLSKKSIATFIKKSMPLMFSATSFLATALYLNNQNYGLAIEYDGQIIATVQNDKIYEEANSMAVDQLNKNTNNVTKLSSTQIKLTPVNRDESCKSSDDVKNKIIEKSQEKTRRGYGVYVDKKLVTVADNKEEVDNLLDQILKDTELKTNFKAEFSENIEIKDGSFSDDEFKSIKEIEKILKGNIKKTEPYTVKENDTIEDIADKFGMDVNKLFDLNNLSYTDEIHVDDEISVEEEKKLLNINLFKIITEEKEIPFETQIEKDNEKEVSYRYVKQEGKNGILETTFRVNYSKNGTEINRQEIERNMASETIPQVEIVGTKEEFKLIWPVPYSHKVTSPFGQRWGKLHSGIDIADSNITGQDIVASENGTVKSVKFDKNGYGNYVVISHNNGYETLYAHCNSISVKEGQTVKKGEVIGKIGSTGHSTGAHLHYEIHESGSAKNPLNYVH
ncbi:MAG: M23 family metallopeptidase [Clostridia bacterium]|nr:M23 family metallopeptidase [Clostridia bacterium]